MVTTTQKKNCHNNHPARNYDRTLDRAVEVLKFLNCIDILEPNCINTKEGFIITLESVIESLRHLSNDIKQ